MAAARRRAARAAGARPRRRRPEVSASGIASRASCRSASASTGCSTPARRSWSCRRSRPGTSTTTSAPAAGLVTGIGRVSGREVVIVANDATVKGGTYYPMTVKKHLRAQEVALREPAAVRLPRGLGRRVPAAAGRGLPRPRALRPHLLQPGAHVGRADPADGGGHGLLHRRRRLRAGDVRRDDHRQGHRHDLPRRSAAREGRDRRRGHRPRSSAAPTSTRGCPASPTTSPKTTSTRCTWRARSSARSTPRRRLPGGPGAARGAGLRSARDCTASSTPTSAQPYDVREIIARLVDGSRFDEFKERYGATLVTGFARLHGMLVGIVANNGVLFSESALKATHFIELCNLRGVPLVFLQNITGLHGRTRSTSAAASPRTAPRWCTPWRTAVVPKLHGRHRRLVRRRQLRHVRPRLRAAAALDVAERAHLGHGRRAGGRRADDREARSARARRQDARARRGSGHPRPHPREVRARGLALLFDGAAVGRRHPRSGGDAAALALGLSAAFNAPIPDAKFGVFRM